MVIARVRMGRSFHGHHKPKRSRAHLRRSAAGDVPNWTAGTQLRRGIVGLDGCESAVQVWALALLFIGLVISSGETRPPAGST